MPNTNHSLVRRGDHSVTFLTNDMDYPYGNIKNLGVSSRCARKSSDEAFRIRANRRCEVLSLPAIVGIPQGF